MLKLKIIAFNFLQMLIIDAYNLKHYLLIKKDLSLFVIIKDGGKLSKIWTLRSNNQQKE
jgi:hypothetical protein